MTRLAMLLLAAACSGDPASPPACHNDPIYGARIQSEGCLPPVQVWIREHALFDGPLTGCNYAARFPDTGECTPLNELLASCPMPDGYSSARYHLVIDYEVEMFLWEGSVRVPSGAYECRQDGGGKLVVVQ